MTQLPHIPARSSAFYVTIVNGAQTIYALGPFRTHRRALGLVDAVRHLVRRAELDPWCEYGYGTARVAIGESLPRGAMNELLHVGPCPGTRPMRRAQVLPTAVLARLLSVSETIIESALDDGCDGEIIDVIRERVS